MPSDPSDLGAVLYVEAVNTDGSIVLSAMDWGGNPNVTTETVPADQVQQGSALGVLFIHQHP